MIWKVPEYTKRQINDAGEIIRKANSTQSELTQAKSVIDNWRAAHAYPLQVFYMNLRNKASLRTDIVVAERLKRLSSITDKLIREPEMELYRMQDLGGCRVVLPTIAEVYEFSDRFKKSRIRHEPKAPKDYIENPKTSGYRSLHFIYRFRTDTPEKEIYNRYSMLIELQFRTHLQHIWATAVEVMGLFTNQALKAGSGDELIKRFFVLVSSLFAIEESCSVVPGTPTEKRMIIAEIKHIDKERHILETLRAVQVAIDRNTERSSGQKGYYILQLNYSKHEIRTVFFKPSEFEHASNTYDILEKQGEGKPIDTVLVQASSIATVKAAYPNYYMDINEFLDRIIWYLQ